MTATLSRAAGVSRRLCIAAAASVLAGFASVPAHAAPAPADVAQLSQDWARDWQAKKLDDVLALYAPDAVFVTGDGTRVTGATALRDFFTPLLKNYSAKIYMRSIDGASSGDLAYDSGDYHELLTPVAANEKKIATHGGWLIVARRIGGHWRISQQFWNGVEPTLIDR
jgi:uncharacterized protein (TIGR02246 family)